MAADSFFVREELLLTPDELFDFLCPPPPPDDAAYTPLDSMFILFSLKY